MNQLAYVPRITTCDLISRIVHHARQQTKFEFVFNGAFWCTVLYIFERRRGPQTSRGPE